MKDNPMFAKKWGNTLGHVFMDGKNGSSMARLEREDEHGRLIGLNETGEVVVVAFLDSGRAPEGTDSEGKVITGADLTGLNRRQAGIEAIIEPVLVEKGILPYLSLDSDTADVAPEVREDSVSQ